MRLFDGFGRNLRWKNAWVCNLNAVIIDGDAVQSFAFNHPRAVWKGCCCKLVCCKLDKSDCAFMFIGSVETQKKHMSIINSS